MKNIIQIMKNIFIKVAAFTYTAIVISEIPGSITPSMSDSKPYIIQLKSPASDDLLNPHLAETPDELMLRQLTAAPLSGVA
jgi:hypothetical protein